MNLLAAAIEAGGEVRLERAETVLLSVLEDAHAALAEWTPNLSIRLQLQARFGDDVPGV